MSEAGSNREAELLRQQDVLARFGELAVRSNDLGEILQEACRLVGDALGTELAKVMELQADNLTLLVRAGVGWQPGVVGQVKVKADPESSEGYALRSGNPVISPDIDAEERFEYADFIKEAGVRALVNVIIIGPEDATPYGLLQVDSRRPREFTEHDTKFLRSYANLIAASVNRLRTADVLRHNASRLRETLDRQEAALETGLIGFFEWNVPAGTLAGDRRFAHFYDLDVDRAAAGLPLEEVFATIHPDDRRMVQDNAAAALASLSDYVKEFRLLHRDGSVRWVLVRGRCSESAAGRPVRYTGTAVDVTASKTIEAALRESEERFRQFGAASSDVLWIRNADTLQFEYVSPAFETVYGVSRDHALGANDLLDWARLIVPEDRERALVDVERVRRGENVTHEFRVERHSDGELRWVQDTVFPLFDRTGRVQRIGGIAHDVTEERATTGRMQVLVAELQHRTRNLIAVVRSLSNKTLAGSASLADFRERFGARLEALSRVNSLLSRLEEGDRITFDTLIRAELSAHGMMDGDGHDAQVVLDGPGGVRLRSSTVQIFALALHELATNALKYGALATPEGRLVVRWRSERSESGQRRLRVDWEESGVRVPPADDTPRRRGYGRELIEKALPFQLKAKTQYEIGPDGVHCTIDLPVSMQLEGENATELLPHPSRPSNPGG